MLCQSGTRFYLLRTIIIITIRWPYNMQCIQVMAIYGNGAIMVINAINGFLRSLLLTTSTDYHHRLIYIVIEFFIFHEFAYIGRIKQQQYIYIHERLISQIFLTYYGFRFFFCTLQCSTTNRMIRRLIIVMYSLLCQLLLYDSGCIQLLL